MMARFLDCINRLLGIAMANYTEIFEYKDNIENVINTLKYFAFKENSS